MFLHSGSYTTGFDFLEEPLDSLGKVVDTSGGLGGSCCGALFGLNIGFGGVGIISGIGASPGAGTPGC